MADQSEGSRSPLRRHDPFKQQNAGLGRWMLAAAALLFVVTVLAKAGFRRDMKSSDPEFWLFGILFLALGVAAYVAAQHLRGGARRHFATSGEALLRYASRPPVIYLRQFSDDVAIPDGAAETFEERLVRMLQPIGPVVAIGDPRDDLPTPGAARLYLRDEDWQARVHELIEVAALVVLRAGETDGIRWEVEQVIAHVRPTRFVLNLPTRDGAGTRLDLDRYRRFVRATASLFPKPLPPWPDGLPFIAFDEDWTPLPAGSLARVRFGAAPATPPGPGLAPVKSPGLAALGHLTDEFAPKPMSCRTAFLWVGLPIGGLLLILSPQILREAAESTWFGLFESERALLAKVEPRLTAVLSLVTRVSRSGPADGTTVVLLPRPIYGRDKPDANADLLVASGPEAFRLAPSMDARGGEHGSIVLAGLSSRIAHAGTRRPSDEVIRLVAAFDRLRYVATVVPGRISLAPAEAGRWAAAIPLSVRIVDLAAGQVVAGGQARAERGFSEGPRRPPRPGATAVDEAVEDLLSAEDYHPREGAGEAERERFARELLSAHSMPVIRAELVRITGGARDDWETGP